MSDARPDSRSAILARLRAAGPGGHLPDPDTAVLERRRWTPAERVLRLRQGMEAIHAEFLEARPDDWPAVIRAFCEREGLRTLLYGPATGAGRRLAEALAGSATALRPYDAPVETFKAELFQAVDAGFTTTLGGVAETGGLLLAPGPHEPRLLSLVPPLHLALLRASTIHDTLWSAIRALGWGQAPPPNALMISGPSKTADIEQTLAYGVHGPKRLVVVLVDDLPGPPA